MKGAVKVFNAITIIFVLILIFWLTQLNYSDLSFKENSNVYFGIGSVSLMIFAMQMIKNSIQKRSK
jgi:hypothetical protein